MLGLASQEANQDPIDLAFLAAARERHIFDAVPAVTAVSFKPFDPQSRRTEAVVEQNGQRLRVMKGAVRAVAQACGLQPPAIEALEAQVSESALKGYRTLAVARGPETGAPGLVGLVTLYDPPRPDAKQLITTLRDLGVPVKMLTGDARPVAQEIGQGVGLANIRRVADLKAASSKAGNEAVDLLAALTLDALVGTGLTLVGLPGLMPLPWWQTLTVLGYAMVSCLVVNDSLKVAMIRWRVPIVVAEKPLGRVPQDL